MVNIGDPSGVASAAIELLSDERAWIAAQQIGLARVRKYYSMKKLIENYGSIYEEAIAHGRNRI